MAATTVRTRIRVLALVCGAAVALAACGPADDGVSAPGTPTPATPQPTSEPAPEPHTPTPDDSTPTPTPAEPAVAPLEGERSTGERRSEPEAGTVAVVDVRIASHDGFDRVVIDIGGDGAPGWITRYTEQATEAGRGQEIPLAGDAVLQVALQGMTLPPELPEDIEARYNERWQAPGGGVVHEVYADTIFEAVQSIFIGVDAELPFVIARLDDPTRVVVDVFHP